MTDLEMQIEQQKEDIELCEQELHDALEELERMKKRESKNETGRDGEG